MSKNYIEFRVYLKDTDNGDEKYVELVAAAADDLHDMITDLLDESEAPDIFTQDVSYQVKYNG